ncbi:MAG TPA: ABC transporter permease subunit [Candidatus Corynebacterium avicola]|uniref:ABC transporter permease subunit n=1 Tax=Candidatus Corynebacterium avicola TaxID=2838527 RepID=A0A9D1RMY6_9CORY|nr:ABC transporter permease subunit [Candidatus Corynebacterium avicola]
MLYVLLILLGALALWWLLAATVLRPLETIPTPGDIISRIADDGLNFYWINLKVTAMEAGQGYLLGVGLAIAVSIIALLFPRLRGIVMQVAVISYSLPIIAVGPVLYLMVGAPSSGDPSATAVLLSALAIFFTTVVGTLLGLDAADQRSLDLVDVYGGSRWTRLVKVQLIAAVPSILTALKVAAPIAVLGAILGEYVGGVDRGLGPALLNAQQASDVTRTWSLALAAAVLAGGWFAVMAMVSRIVNRLGWGAAEVSTTATRIKKKSPLAVTVEVIVSLIVIGVVWTFGLRLFGISEFVGRTPAEVISYLTSSSDPAEGGTGENNFATLLPDLWRTLLDTGTGFLLGLVAAIAVASLFLVFPAVERGLMPLALFFQSVPLVAIAPVLIIVFGRGQFTVAVMGAIIVFFPALVNIGSALKNVPPALVDLVRTYGAGRGTELVKVRIPACLPAIFAAIRIAVPGALSGALLAEWLATGEGIGNTVITAVGNADTDVVWASVTVVTGTALILYGVASLLESSARKRWGT